MGYENFLYLSLLDWPATKKNIQRICIMKLLLQMFTVLFTINASAQIKNFMFIGMDREQLQDTSKWATNELLKDEQIAIL
jgi:hypothetical protein